MSERLELEYDLFGLPTAQHRAGLAGLLLISRIMHGQGMEGAVEARVDDVGSATISLTETSFVMLFDYLYASTIERVREPKERKPKEGKPDPLLGIETEVVRDKRGREQVKTWFIYPQVVPSAPFLRALDMPEVWRKLWLDIVWRMLRAIPETRRPYNDRAAGRHTGVATSLWEEIQRGRRQETSGSPRVTKVASTLLLGSMDKNAEQVPFQGRPAETLLLHFWPVVMGLGETWRLKAEKGRISEEPEGYVLAVPDVTDLETFPEEFVAGIGGLGEEKFLYRPRDAVLALPPEGGLEYLHHLTMLAKAQAERGDIRHSVSGVEVYHLVKRGNSVVTLATGHVPARPGLLERYEAIRGRYTNLLFRAQLIRNVLADRPWYTGFGRLFDTRDQDLFLSEGFGSFRADARRKFTEETGTLPV